MLLSVMALHVLPAAIIPDVRAALNQGDFAKAESLIAAHRGRHGQTAELLEAHSWLGRAALGRKQWDRADEYATETRKMALAMLEGRKLDDEKHLPIALGASIEVQGQAAAGRGERSSGVSFLKQELARWHATSIRTRIQKNIHLLSLEGSAPPPLEMKEWLGEKPPTFHQLKGSPALLFFWAHWCSDCKAQLPILVRIKEEFESKGLRIVGPTQPYGYVAGGVEAPRDKEVPYIDEVRKGFFGALNLAAPVSEENFKVYGVSSTPTLVLLDKQGVVRMYHPGRMPYEELAPKIAELLR
jgi:thiol-disulfide isomerase/thioredoxin